MVTDKHFTDAFEEAVRKQSTDSRAGNERETLPAKAKGKYTVIQYSEKSVAVFGDTKAIKGQLSALGGRFNMHLTLNGERCAGWVFPKGKEDDLRRLVSLY